MAVGGRDRPALPHPPADLDGFPRWRLRPDRRLYRAHARERGPWWYASDAGGRFNLAVPHGTCYLATTLDTALRERFGHELVDLGVVMRSAAVGTVVSRLRVRPGRSLADLAHEDAARFGVTREIGTLSDYERTREWAAALHAGGAAGIRYQSRFTTGPQGTAVAVFGEAGATDDPADPAPIAGPEACAIAGLLVAEPPRLRQVRISRPPSR